MDYQSLNGMKFNRLTVIGNKMVDRSEVKKERYLECVCECGNKLLVPLYKLRNGHTKSCGCFNRDNVRKINITHGEKINGKISKEYRAWQNMKTRCRIGKNYIKNGITVCDRWLDFNNFLNDMGRATNKGLTVERINNLLGYSPDNCKWETTKKQNINKCNNVNVTFNGKTQCIAEWAREIGMKKEDLQYRYNIGEIYKYLNGGLHGSRSNTCVS